MFLTIIIFSTFFAPELDSSSNYKNLLTYEPEKLIYHAFSIFINTRLRLIDMEMDDYCLSEYLSSGYQRRYYSPEFEYKLAITGRQNISVYENSKRYHFDFGINGMGEYYILDGLFSGSFHFGMNPRVYKLDKWHKFLSGEVQIGLGLGRLIPIAPMDKALKIQKELIESGVITESFAIETLKEIANLIALQSNYNDPREFWNELESVIANSGLIEGNKLGAAATIRLNEILKSNITWNLSYPRLGGYRYFGGPLAIPKDFPEIVLSERMRGFEVEVYLGGRYRSGGNYEDNFFIGGRFDYSYPLSPKLQISFNSISELFPGDTIKWRRARVKTELSYEIYRRLFSRLRLSYNGLNTAELWTITAGLDYLIEYKMLLSPDISFIYSNRDNKLYMRFFLGFKYQFF